MYFFWLIELVHIQYLLNGTTMNNDQNPLCVSFNKGETIVFFCTSFMSSAIFMLQKANELALRQSCISSYVVLFSIYIYENITSTTNLTKTITKKVRNDDMAFEVSMCAVHLCNHTLWGIIYAILFVGCCCSQVPLGMSSTTLHKHLICTAMLYYNATETVVLLFTMIHNNVYYNYTELDLSVWSSSVFVLKYHVTVCLRFDYAHL